jgi:hypothetical protein
MHSEELERAKIDLETIRSIAGIVESPNREDLWLNLLTAIAGGLALAWALLPHGLWQIWGLLAALAPFSYLVKLRWKYRASTGASPARRRSALSRLGGTVAGHPGSHLLLVGEDHGPTSVFDPRDSNIFHWATNTRLNSGE